MADKSYKKNDILIFVTQSMKKKTNSGKRTKNQSKKKAKDNTKASLNRKNKQANKQLSKTDKNVVDSSSPTKKKTFKSRFLKFLWYLIFTGFILAVAGSIGIIVYIVMLMQELPSPQELANFTLVESTRIYDREGNLLYEVSGDERREKVDLEVIPEYCKDAILSAEDANFYSHSGFSWKGILRSVYMDAKRKITGSGSIVGGSTITQQFVKNAYLTREKTIERKLKELILSMQIESAFTKDEILELYMNAISFGSNAHGIQTAATSYFGKNVQELSLPQCALLAALPQAPSYYSPYGSHTEDLIYRYEWILKRMNSLGKIDDLLYATALEEDVLATIQPFRQDIAAPHFVFYVKEILEQKYGSEMVEQGGLQVYTTLDPHLQDAAETSVREGIEGPLLQYNATNSALVSLNPKTGGILAMVGSRDYFMDEVDGQVNITTSLQQPGSSFKPIAYTSLFANKKGIGPGSVLYDVETNFGDSYMPGNFDGKFWGPTSIRRALAGSRNIPAIKAGYLAGIQETIKLGYRLGLSTFEQSAALTDHAGMSYALGTLEVTPLDMAVAYGTLANGGYRIPANPILKIIDGTGAVIEEYTPPEGEPAIIPNDLKKNEQVAYMINDILSDGGARPPGWGALSIPGHTVAAKTGTSNAKKNGVNYPQDLWTIGYTPSIVTITWGGNTRNGILSRNASGLMGITPTFNSFMSEALKDTEDEPFQRPNGIIEKTVTKTSTYIYGEFHSILYYLNKDDPQFSRWESSVKAWGRNKSSNKDEAEDNTDNPESDSAEGGEVIYVDSLDKIPTDACTEEMMENYEDAPEIAFLAPPQNGKVSLGQNKIQLSIEEHFSLRSVEYYFDNELQYTANRRPYDEGTINVPEDTELGSIHTIKIIAIDSANNHKSASSTVTVASDATPPTVEITSPHSNRSFNPGEKIEISVNAYDERSAIDNIEILFDGKFVTNVNPNISFFYTIPTDTERGDHTLTARAFDTEGNAALERMDIRISGRIMHDDDEDNSETGDGDSDTNNDSNNNDAGDTSTSDNYDLSLQLIGDEFYTNESASIEIQVTDGELNNIKNIKVYANNERIDVIFGVQKDNKISWTPPSAGTYDIYAEANSNLKGILATSNHVTILAEDR